jgi:hypothetical protein
MTIQEAIKGGKPFKRAIWRKYWVLSDGGTQFFPEGSSQWNIFAEVTPSVDDILATDWEIGEER